MRYLVASTVLALSGCATATNIPLPDNQAGIAIDCPNRVAKCYAKAQEVCPNGYEIMDKGSQTVGGFANGVGAIGSRTTLIIRCK